MALILLLLIRILVLNPEGKPVVGAWVEVDGMYKSGFWEEQTTDSRGVFIVAVETGAHQIVVTKQGYKTWAEARMMSDDKEDIVVRMVR